MKLRYLGVALTVAACGPTIRQTGNGDVDAAAPGIDAAIAQLDAPSLASGPVHVVITADNAYSFGYGDVGAITHFYQGQRAQTAGQIFNCPIGEGPEVYDVPAADAPEGAYLYIVTWDDLSVTQGVLGSFTRDSGRVLTGDEHFEVCATGIDYSNGPNALTGPDQSVINAEIARCNAGTGDATATSKGWVNVSGATTTGAQGSLAVGEANDSEADAFHIACQPTATTEGIAADAHWMWYWPGDGAVGDAFHSDGTNRFKAFLIFRLAAGAIIL